MTVLAIYCNSYQVSRIESENGIAPEVAREALERNEKYTTDLDGSKNTFWASITTKNIESRYKIVDGVFTCYMVFDWNNPFKK